MRVLVREMREERAPGTDALCRGDRFRHGQVKRMWTRQQRAEHQHVESRQGGDDVIGNRLHVRQIRHRAHAIAEDRVISVRQGQRQDRHPDNEHGLSRLEHMRLELRLARSDRHDNRRIEDVGKLRRQLRHRAARAIGRQHRALTDGECAQVVDAMHVVGVRVREQHRVDVIDAGRDELQPQLGWRVDQEPFAPGLDQCGGPGTPVAGVNGCTGSTATADLRHAKRRAGAEKDQPHVTLPRP